MALCISCFDQKLHTTRDNLLIPSVQSTQMAYSPEPGLIVDEQYENEDQQLLSEVHFVNKPISSDTASVDCNINTEMDTSSTQRSSDEQAQTSRTVSKVHTTKPETVDYGKQADVRRSEKMLRDYAKQRQARKSGYGNFESGRSRKSEKVTKMALASSEKVSRPGPILGDEQEEVVHDRKANYSNLEELEAARAAWVPPKFRSHKPPAFIDWLDPRVRQILRNLKDKHIGPQRASYQLQKLTGEEVSHTTIRAKCRILDELDEQYRQKAVTTKSKLETYDASSTFDDDDSASSIVKPGINAPIAAPPDAPYYLSFSYRFKQTSLTVPLNRDEVRLYRHASHSKSGRTIHFRCSRCDTLHQIHKSGPTARMKMVDGIVVSQLYPEHHPLCKPIKLVEAHAMEIEKRCRKDIIQGMNPKEAWKKGRKAAISEATALGFPVYGPGSILSAFPEWNKCKTTYGALRSRFIRRQMAAKKRPGGKGNKDDTDDFSRRKFEVADYDVSDDFRQKKSWLEQAGAYSSAVRHDDGASMGGTENIAVSEGEDIAGMDFELDDFEEESLYNFMHNANKPAVLGRTCAGISMAASSSATKYFSESLVANPARIPENKTGLSATKKFELSSQSIKLEETANYHQELEVREVEKAIARASLPASKEPVQVHPSFNLPSAVASPVSSVPSAVVPERHGKQRTELIDEATCITFVSPAGVLPCAKKREEYIEMEQLNKLREIEKAIAQYNALCDDKIATIFVSKERNIKFFGSKYIVDSCLHSSVCQNLWDKFRESDDLDEEVDDDELVSIPLIRCRSTLEINSAPKTEVRGMLNSFLASMHFPWEPWFDIQHCPDYWPPAVPFYDPNNDLLSLSNLSQRRDLESHSIVDLERDILKFAYSHYANFMKYHFGIVEPGPRNPLPSESRDQNRLKHVQTVDRAQMTDREIENGCDVPRHRRLFDAGSTVSSSDVAVPGASCNVAPSVGIQCMDEQLALFRNSVLRIRYDTMVDDVRSVFESVCKIQSQSTCKVLVLYMDERNKMSVAGDKTLISAFLNSNIPQCLPTAMSFSFDNHVITLPLLQLYDDLTVDQMSEEYALDLLEDMMRHINFTWSDPYEGEQPDCWPPEIPFCSPWANSGRNILNRRIGANTPGQAAKVVLKSVRWFYSEFIFEKLKMKDFLEGVAPILADLTHHILTLREGCGFLTPISSHGSMQEFTGFRVPKQAAQASSKSQLQSPSEKSYISRSECCSQLSATSQDIAVLAQDPVVVSTANPNTQFVSQDLPLRPTTPQSPSQHSIASQETVPFRLPPNHPMVNPQMQMQPPPQQQQQQLGRPAESYVSEDFDTQSQSYITASRNADVADSRIYAESEQNFATEGPSTEFRMPHLPPQQTLPPDMRTAQWTSNHSSLATSSSMSHQSTRRSHHRLRSSSHQHYEKMRSHRPKIARSGRPGISSASQIIPRQYDASSQQPLPLYGEVQGPFPGERNGAHRMHPYMQPSRRVRATPDFDPLLYSIAGVPPQPAGFAAAENLVQPADHSFLKVLCSCGPGVELDSRECLRCDRCRKYFHNKCMPLTRRDRMFLCISCSRL